MIDLKDGNSMHIFLTFFLLTIAIFIRYLVIAGLFYYYVIKLNKAQIKLSSKSLRHHQIQHEIINSLLTSVIFGLLGTIVLYAWQHGYTRIYIAWDAYPFYWMIISISFILLIHETYYYWLHRWMHRPGIYKWIHRTHHESLTTTAWTSFSFHPIESLLQGLPILIMLFIIPIHPITLAILVLIMTITSVINHINSELYPSGSARHWIGKWWIGATHHHLHHTEFHTNFGLYFTFWDHWMHTESSNYHKLFEEKTKKV